MKVEAKKNDGDYFGTDQSNNGIAEWVPYIRFRPSDTTKHGNSGYITQASIFMYMFTVVVHIEQQRLTSLALIQIAKVNDEGSIGF